jgi:hypothetical protein
MPLTEPCPGCGAELEPVEGPTHAYMESSPACFAAFNALLTAEYSGYGDPALRDVHRLTVDTWAVQHPGSPEDRRAIQSVGLHLGRLWLQLESSRPPAETNAIMLDFSRHKATLPRLPPPASFRITASDIAPFAGSSQHAAKVREWAEATWQDWSSQHAFIRSWVAAHSVHGGR